MRLSAAVVTLLAALVAAFSILVAAWSFSYPGRIQSCKYALTEYAKTEPERAHLYCLKNVELNL